MILRLEHVRIGLALGKQQRSDHVQRFHQLARAAILIDKKIFFVRHERFGETAVGFGIGAAKRVDRLLRISDHDRLAGHERTRPVAREPIEDLDLHAVGVLKLIDKYVIILFTNSIERQGAVEQRTRPHQQIVEVQNAAFALLLVETRDEARRQLEKSAGGAMADQQIVDTRSRFVAAKDAQAILQPLVALEMNFSEFDGHRREVIDPGIDGAAFGRWRRSAEILCINFDRRAQRRLVLRDRADVVFAIEKDVALVDQREDRALRLEEISVMLEQRFPLRGGLGIRMVPRLIVDPLVVNLSVQQRSIEPFDDSELRIDSRLDRILPQQRLAERVDGLRAEAVDARELPLDRLATRVALRRRDFEKGMIGIARPADAAFAFELRSNVVERVLDAVGNFARRFFGEGDQHNSLRRDIAFAQQKLEDFGDDGGGLASARAGLDDLVPPLWSADDLGGASKCKRLLLRGAHSISSSSVRGSFDSNTTRRSASECFVRHE